MLELKKAERTPELLRLCAEHGVACVEDSELFAAYCGGVVGCCAFTVEGTELTICGAWVDEALGAALCDGLVRAVYQYALVHGAKTASFSSLFPEMLWQGLAAFGHSHKTDNDIDIFLSNCKNCARKP